MSSRTSTYHSDKNIKFTHKSQIKLNNYFFLTIFFPCLAFENIFAACVVVLWIVRVLSVLCTVYARINLICCGALTTRDNRSHWTFGEYWIRVKMYKPKMNAPNNPLPCMCVSVRCVYAIHVVRAQNCAQTKCKIYIDSVSRTHDVSFCSAVCVNVRILAGEQWRLVYVWVMPRESKLFSGISLAATHAAHVLVPYNWRGESTLRNRLTQFLSELNSVHGARDCAYGRLLLLLLWIRANGFARLSETQLQLTVNRKMESRYLHYQFTYITSNVGKLIWKAIRGNSTRCFF